MRIDFDRHVPLGWGGRNTAAWLCAALLTAAVVSLWCFVGHYQSFYRELFYYSPGGEKIWISGQVMPPFPMLLTNCEVGFQLILAAMPVLAVFMYLHHWRGSNSIYLMRRLPNRRELHRRCLTLPVLGAVASMALLGLLCGIFYLIYILCTPARCLPV